MVWTSYCSWIRHSPSNGQAARFRFKVYQCAHRQNELQKPLRTSSRAHQRVASISDQHACALAIAKKYKLIGRQKAFGLELFFACKPMFKGARAEHLLLLSNRFQGKEALRLYRKRRGIERLFWHLKQKGFDLESTHMTSAPKLDKLFAVLALGFLVSFAWGCQIRHLKQQYSKQSKSKSLFRLGLEDILRIFLPIQSKDKKKRDKRREEQDRFKRWILQDKFYAIFLV